MTSHCRIKQPQLPQYLLGGKAVTRFYWPDTRMNTAHIAQIISCFYVAGLNILSIQFFNEFTTSQQVSTGESGYGLCLIVSSPVRDEQLDTLRKSLPSSHPPEIYPEAGMYP